MKPYVRTVLMMGLLVAVTGLASAQIITSAKPVTYPFGLSVAGPVQYGSAADNAYFGILRTAVLGNNLTTGNSVPGIASVRLDPSKIDLALAADVKVYMVGDEIGNGTGKEYAVGFNPAGPGVTTGDPKLVFPLAQTNGSSRSGTFPVLPGDYVDLGQFAAGSHLDFFAIADPTPGYSLNNAGNLEKVFSTADGNQSARLYALTGTSYLLVTFEGRDKFGVDYNDVAFAVDIGAGNIRRLMGAPEPSLVLALGSFAGVILAATRRTRRQA